jgi:DNA-binding response OmpR family regulator
MREQTQPTVLIVDDDPLARELYRAHLQERGYHARVAGDGEQALQEITSSRPDVVLLDIVLPTMSGFDVLARMKSHPEAAGIPVIMLTNRSEPEDVERGLALGATDYLIKVTASPKQVLDRITHAIASQAWGSPPIYLTIDPTRSDVRRLAETAGSPLDLSCRACGHPMRLMLRRQPFHPGCFTATLVCLDCPGDH